MSGDRPLLGILLMFGFCMTVPFADGLAKIAGETLPIALLVLVRFVAQGVLLTPIVWVSGRSLALPRRVLWLLGARSVLHIVGLGAMFTAFRFLPLADAIAIAFVMPFLLLFLGYWFLNEEVGWRRIAAALVGFGGTLLVIQPSFAAVGAPALLPLLVAAVFAGFMLITRRIARIADPITLQAVGGWQAAALLVPVLAFGAWAGIDDLALAMPAGREWALLAGIAVLGTLAHLLMSWSLRFAPSATLAPMQYLEIPMATLVGWVMFRELPDGLAATGIVVIVAAGLYIVYREGRLSREKARLSAPAAPPAA